MQTYLGQEKQSVNTLYDCIRMHADRNPGKTYLLTERKILTYGEAAQITGNAADMFRKCGMKKGDLVALRATRSPDTVLLSAAVGAVGAIAVMTDPHIGIEPYIAEAGSDIQPAFWLTNEKNSRDLDAEGGWELRFGDNVCKIPLGSGAPGAFREPELPSVSPEDPFMIIFTSGSTGTSKAVLLSHRNWLANPEGAMALFAEGEKDRAIALIPLHHVLGFAAVVCATYCGHDVLFPSSVRPDHVLSCIGKYRVTCMYAVPTFFMELIRGGGCARYDLSSLRFGLMAGAPFTPGQIEETEKKLGMRILPGYGMSECIVISIGRYDDSAELRASGAGRLFPMTEIRFENGAGTDRESEGEICVRGATRMLGYYEGGKTDRDNPDSDGWMHTGDLGYMDAEGVLHISGRKKDIIIRNGNNLSSAEIERKLLSIPFVFAAAVTGVPDPKCGELPYAAVVTDPKYGMITETEIREKAGMVLNKLMMPVEIRILPSLPLMSSGKVDKKKIREIFVGGATSRSDEYVRYV